MSARTPMLSVIPLRFDPSMEVAESDEAETNAGLIEMLGKISQTTFEHSGHAIRSVHAKGHGVLRGEVTVHGGLPAELAQGMFARAGQYQIECLSVQTQPSPRNYGACKRFRRLQADL